MWNTASVVVFSRTSDKSRPAQKALPSPVSTAARASDGRFSKQSRRAATSWSLRALRLAGRQIVTRATAPAISSFSNGEFWVSVMVALSPPGAAEGAGHFVISNNSYKI
jgi:hypothetical protein